uniref:Copper-binding protein PcoE n=1 Tax=Klebsiella pneumoniae TaxID=573 RepID=A0A8B0SSK8_KLEPN|nr:Copper-binding protein PcoE [Klebsiella pneumoniae]
MNEHEKAAVVHEKANNGQSSVIHQQQAEKASQPDHPELTRSSTCQTLI